MACFASHLPSMRGFSALTTHHLPLITFNSHLSAFNFQLSAFSFHLSTLHLTGLPRFFQKLAMTSLSFSFQLSAFSFHLSPFDSPSYWIATLLSEARNDKCLSFSFQFSPFTLPIVVFLTSLLRTQILRLGSWVNQIFFYENFNNFIWLKWRRN